MKITPALAYEKLRQDAESQNKIILHKDGKFYHVYEWSAWLIAVITFNDEVRMWTKDRHHLFEEIDGDIIKAA